MHSLATNSLILTASNILNAALGFALSLVIGRGLGESGFGVWVFCLAWASILMMICEFGISSLLTREAARTPEKSNRLLFVSLALKLALITIFGGVVWFFAPSLAIDSASARALSMSLLIVIAGIAYSSFTAIFRSFGWMYPILWLNLLGGIVQLGWSVWIIRSNGGIVPLLWAAITIDFAQLSFAMLLWWNRIRPHGGILALLPSDMTQIMRDALPFGVSAVLGAIEARSSVLLLGYLSGGIEVGQFGMASRFFEAARLLPNGVYDAAFPAFASQKSGEMKNKLVFQNLSWIILGYTGIVSLILIIFPRHLIHLTYGDAFLSATASLRLSGVALLPTLHNALLEVYLFASGDEKFATKLSLFGLVVQVVMSIPLMFLYGASGAAAGILIAELAIWLPLQRRVKKLSP